MDLYFQGTAWLNKGTTPDNVTQARGFFDRALAADPGNVDALVGSALADAVEDAISFVTDPTTLYAAAEEKLARALSTVPEHSRAHLLLGIVYISTKRAAQGIAECEHALALDRNLAHAHSYIGFGKTFIGRAEETEAHVLEALRLSPRDTMAYRWMTHRRHSEEPTRPLGGSCRVVSPVDRSQPKFSAPHTSCWPARSRSSGELTKRAPRSRRGSYSTRASPSPAFAPMWTAKATTRHISPSLEPVLDGMRKAGVPDE